METLPKSSSESGTPVLKTCTRCSSSKPTSEFHRCAKSRDGLQPRCKLCKSEVGAAAFAARNPEGARLKEAKQAARAAGKKHCPGCDRAHDLDGFSRNSTTSDGLQVYCRDCMSAAVMSSHERKAEHYREKAREGAKTRYHATKHLLDREAASERWKAWAARNIEHVRAYGSAWQRTTKQGWISTVLQGLRQRSKRRGLKRPCFDSTDELEAWLATTNFEELWAAYVASGHETPMRPSIDRLDNARPYTIDNIRLVTWKQNLDAWNKSEEARENGRKSRAKYLESKGTA